MDARCSIDGKTLRGSFDAFNDRKAAHVLSAFASDDQIILGHLAIDDNSAVTKARFDQVALPRPRCRGTPVRRRFRR